MLHKVQRLTDREPTEVHDAQAADRHGKADIGQAVPVALRARTLGHALLEFFSHRVGLRFGESARDVVENALKGPLERAASVCALIIDREIFLARAVQNGVQRVLGKVLHGRCERELIFFCKRLKIHPGDRVVLDVIEAAGLDRAVQDRLVPVGDDKVGVCDQLRAETRADRARAVGIVEREHARRELRKTDAAVLAGVVLGEDRVAVVCHFVQNHKAARKRQRGLDRVRQTSCQIGLHDEPVNDDLDVVLFVFVERNFFCQIIDAAVDPHARVAAFSCVLKDLCMLTLFSAHNRGEYLKARLFGKAHDLIDDLVDSLPLDLFAALRTVRHTAARP